MISVEEDSPMSYRDDLALYVEHKKKRYRLRDHLSDKDAGIKAVARSQEQMHDSGRDDLKIYAVQVVQECFDKSDGSYFRVKIFGREGKDRLADVCVGGKGSPSGGVIFTAVSSSSRSIHLPCACAVPSLGKLECLVKSGLTGARRKFVLFYDLHQVHANASAIGMGKEGIVSAIVPLYSPSSVDIIVKGRIPCAEIRMIVAVVGTGTDQVVAETADQVLRLTGIDLVIHDELDVHHAYYTRGASIEQNRTFNPVHARRMRLWPGRSSAARTTLSANAGNIGEVDSTIASFMGPGATFSWSVSHMNEVVLSKNGLSEWCMGHVGDLMFSLLAIRAAHGISPTVCSDTNLCDPSGLERLLTKAGRLDVYEALKSLYIDRCGRTPSVLQLVTHTSGLPAHASMDARIDILALEKVLSTSASAKRCASSEEPCGGGIPLLCRLLRERVDLVGEPGSVYHPSPLGLSVLACCFPNLASCMREIFSEMSMESSHTRTSGLSPYDDSYPVSSCVWSTSNDMARYVCCIEKSCVDACAHPYLGLSMVPMYSVGCSGSRTHSHSITYGGWESTTVKIRVRNNSDGESTKISVGVFFKIGESRSALKTCGTMLVWVPGLHVGFSLCHDMPLRELFSRTHKAMKYGKLSETKKFRAKHLIKSVVRQICATMGSKVEVDFFTDLGFSQTPRYPPHMFEFEKRCGGISLQPQGPWQKTLCEAKVFVGKKGRGKRFYPLFQSSCMIRETLMRGETPPVKEIMAGVDHVRVYQTDHRGKRTWVVEDSQLRKVIQLGFDPSYKHLYGSSLLAAEGLGDGAFRLASNGRPGGYDEHLVVTVLPGKTIGVLYRGCLYVSKGTLAEHMEYQKTVVHKQKFYIHQAKMESETKEFFWKKPQPAPASPVALPRPDEKKIEGSSTAGWAVGAGLLGFGLGASMPRPYYYYPPPPPPSWYYYNRYPY